MIGPIPQVRSCQGLNYGRLDCNTCKTRAREDGGCVDLYLFDFGSQLFQYGTQKPEKFKVPVELEFVSVRQFLRSPHCVVNVVLGMMINFALNYWLDSLSRAASHEKIIWPDVFTGVIFTAAAVSWFTCIIGEVNLNR
jgi:hypothetical protein